MKYAIRRVDETLRSDGGSLSTRACCVTLARSRFAANGESPKLLFHCVVPRAGGESILAIPL
ncbi:hypothetical protein ABH945_005186 [Paraburkholderia sp. GAS333]